MNQRPPSITIISVLLMLLGTVLFVTLLLEKPDADQARRVADFTAQHPFHAKVEHYIPMMAVEVFTVLCGALLFFGFNAGRWLFFLWLIFHIFLGLLNSIESGLFHGILFSAILYFLFSPKASAYFKRPRTKSV